MKSSYLLFALLVLTTKPSGFAEDILREDFESYVEEVEITSYASRWKVNSAGEPNFLGKASIQQSDGALGNETKYLSTTPGGGDATTQNVSTEFPAISGNVTIKVDVFPVVGTGCILLATPEGNGQHPVLLQFLGAGGVVRTATRKPDGEMELVEIGRFQLHRWYHVTLKLRLDDDSGLDGGYDITIADAINDEIVAEAVGLKPATSDRIVNGIILSATFGATSHYGWDNLLIETTP